MTWPTRLVAALIVFLPFSAWLVSVTGSAWISLGRDLLLLLMLGAVIKGQKWQWPKGSLWIGLFVIHSLLSYFWRDESLGQWLRAIRYLDGPLVVYLVVAQLQLGPGELRRLLRLTIWTGLAVVLIGFAEYFFPALTRFVVTGEEGRGFLGDIHQAGSLQRLQSVLAGPNALGLYLITLLLLIPAWLKHRPRPTLYLIVIVFLAALIMTFSRSAALGLIFGLVALIGTKISSDSRRLALTMLGLIVAGAALLLVVSPSALTRPTSNEIRFQQYERVWEQKQEIGLLGRGPGSAGLVSQYRLDGGPNNFTENSYLDVFEGLGLVGFVLYLIIWLTVLLNLARSQVGRLVWPVGLGLAIAGLLINHYTGQAAIWLFWLWAGLAIGSEAKK